MFKIIKKTVARVRQPQEVGPTTRMVALTDDELMMVEHALQYRAKQGGWSMHDSNTGRIAVYDATLAKVTEAMDPVALERLNEARRSLEARRIADALAKADAR